MAFEAEQRVVAAHAEAIVGDADQTASARLNLHGNFFRVGIEGIFHQFLDDACGPLDNFAGGDLIRDVLGQQADAVHFF